MPRLTKRELLEENEELRAKLEEIHSQGEILEIEDDDSDKDADSDEEDG